VFSPTGSFGDPLSSDPAQGQVAKLPPQERVAFPFSVPFFAAPFPDAFSPRLVLDALSGDP